MVNQELVGEWLIDHWKKLLLAIGAFLVLAALIWKQFGSGISDKEYYTATQQFNVFKKEITASPTKDTEALKALANLQPLLDKYPDLQQKYNGQIAQLLLAAGKETEALPYAKKLLQYSYPKSVQAYVHFGSTTVALAEGQWDKAMQSAQQMDVAATSPSLLRAFNRLQISLLELTSESKTHSELAWADLQESFSEPEAQPLVQLFTAGHITLSQFMQKSN